MIGKDEFCKAAGAIPYQYRHPEFLYGLIRWRKPRIIIEVGTHIGMAAVWMARAIQENGVGCLYCIDSFCWKEHDQRRLWEANMKACGVRDTITLIEGRSEEVQWPAMVDMAYIDGNHSYKMCRWDAEKAVTLGASCVALKTIDHFAGVRRYSEEIRLTWSGWDFIEGNFDTGLMVAIKREKKPVPDHPDFDEWDK